MVRRILDGVMRAFELLVLRHQESVARFVWKVVPNEQDREEVCQDVFVKLYQKLDQFRFDAKFTTWLYRVAYRTAIAFTRKKRLDTESYKDEFTAESNHENDSRQVAKILDKHIAGLKLEERTAVTLHYLQELSIEEISDIVERPTGTIKSMLHRIRQKLNTSILRTTPDLIEAI